MPIVFSSYVKYALSANQKYLFENLDMYEKLYRLYIQRKTLVLL